MARKKNQTKMSNEVNKENSIVEDLVNSKNKDIPEKVTFINPDDKNDEAVKIPKEFIEVSTNVNQESEFAIKNGRPYKKIDEFRGLYTDTGEVFRLSR